MAQARFEVGQTYTGSEGWNTLRTFLCTRRTEKHVYFQCKNNSKPCRFDIRRDKDGEYAVNAFYIIHANEQFF